MTYWDWVEREATKTGSDGCTLVSELFHICCLEHDLAFAYHTDPRKAYNLCRQGIVNFWHLAPAISRREADARFRRCIQDHSKLGKWSPVAWLRWIGVRAGGHWSWQK